jgi:transcriptional regulator with XRE-family HTH domain
MTQVQSLLSKLKSFHWTDQQIADRVGVNRVTINKLRNGTASKGETGESILPMLRQLLAETKRQSLKKKQPATRKEISRTSIQQTSKPSEDEQTLDSFLDQSMLSTFVENMPKPDDTIHPEIRKIVEREKTQQTHIPIPSRPQPPFKLTQQPLPASTCADCGMQNVRLFRKTADVTMGMSFIYVCAKCLKKPVRPQLRQGQSAMPTPQLTRIETPWSQVFKRKEK